MAASQNGHKEIVELLIEKGAEVDRAKTPDGRLLCRQAKTDTRKLWSY